MHPDGIKIIEILRKEDELSTGEIIEKLHPTELAKIKKETESITYDKDKENIFKRKKAQLHRKTLYHINRLVNDNILKISRISGKNQKYFSLIINDDEDLIIGKRRIIISKPNLPAMPIEGFLQKEILKKFEESTWISRSNACILQCKNFENIIELKKTVKELFSFVNDVVGINDFETIIEKTNIQDIINFIETIDHECLDYAKRVSIIIDFSNIRKESRIIEFIKEFSKIKPSNINIIFDINSNELKRYEEIILNVIKEFHKNKIRIYIKNQKSHDAPYIQGRAGPYTFDPQEWKTFREEYKGEIKCVICGQTTISIDVEKFFEYDKNSFRFRELVLNTAKSLLYANYMQRSRSNEYFRYMIDLEKPNSNSILSLSRSYIRFWNYGWKENKLEPDLVLDLMKSTKEIIDEFCTSEETIYKACGMPTRFKLGFSCAYKEANKEEFSGEKFKKLQIRKLEDIYSTTIKELLFEKEKIFRLFDGGDRLRIHRGGEINPEEIIREFNIILDTFNLPFFCYDFGKVQGGDLSLNTFIE